MSNKLKFFMQEELKKEEIVEVPGIETFKDENGQIIPFKIKVLGIEEIDRLRNAFKSSKVALDKKGRPIVDGGELVHNTSYDSIRANDKIIAEALVFPDLHDKELMDFYGVYDSSDMPRKLFRNPADYNYVSKTVAEVIGLIEKDDNEVINEAKN